MLGENIRLALHSLTANKLRTFLTMLGIMIGIASVVAIYTLGTSQTKTYELQMASSGINNIQIYMGSDDWENHANDVYMSEDLLDKFLTRYEGRLAAIAAYYWGDSGKLFADEKTIEDRYNAVECMGVTRGYFTCMNMTLVTGRTFTSGEMKAGSAVCVISDYAVRQIYDGDTSAAMGSTVHLKVGSSEDYKDFRVVGIYSYDMSNAYFGAGTTRAQDISTEIYIPYSYLINNASEDTVEYYSHPSVFYVQVAVGEDAAEMADDMADWLKAQFPSDYMAYVSCYSDKASIEEMRQSMSAQVRTTAMIAAIALLVGGIGVMNIMTVTITERTREIGTRKALGAKSKDIRQQFVVESAVMSLIGGTIGMVLGLIGGVVSSNMSGYTLAIPWEAILGSFAISLAIGIFFGYYPADKAAKLDPIEALRYE